MSDVKNTMKLMIASLSDNVTEILRGHMFNYYSDSYESGETIEDREIKKLQKVWTRGFVCLICGDAKCEAAFSDPTRVSEDGTVVKSGSVVEDMQNGKIQPTSILTAATPRDEFSFETKEEFDQHMKTVHGICIEDALDELPEEEIMKRYGSHYYNFKHGHKIVVCKGDESKHIKIKPHHRPFTISDDLYKDKSIIIDNKDKDKQ